MILCRQVYILSGGIEEVKMYKGRQNGRGIRTLFKNFSLRGYHREESAPICRYNDTGESSGSEEDVYLNEEHSRFEPTPGNPRVPQDKKRKWRHLPLNVTEPMLTNIKEEGGRVDVVFPGGIFLRLASNANKFAVELQLKYALRLRPNPPGSILTFFTHSQCSLPFKGAHQGRIATRRSSV
tara:strand:- start:1282 stop:1824 length:543 start_codon:yes stop_codon:yes gene_type:complete